MKRPFARAPIRPDRVRCVERGFAFVPNRFLHAGFLASLSQAELALYFFLIVAGDQYGVSFYGDDRILSTLSMTRDEYLRARKGLLARDLIAYDGRRFQVLSLPPQPLLPLDAIGGDDEDAATIRALIRASLAENKR